jgi:hypothetical protein
MATKTMNCPRCAGTGIYTGYGTCFRCEGAKVVPFRKERVFKTETYRPIERLCIDWNSPHALLAQARPQTVEYYGGRAYFEELAEAWDLGYREIRITKDESLPRFR